MAKVTFSSEINVKPQRQTFPKLSKLKKGEKVRIQLMNTDDIDMEFVHQLEEPVIVDGQGELDDKGKFKKTFVSNPLSFGDASILEEKGIDPKNCPISKMAKEHPDWVSPPRRKFAMHIIEYRTKPGTFELTTPFNVEHKVWVFTEKTWIKLRDFAKEWGDLRTHDLYITCENEKFQQYDISVAPNAAWQKSQEDAKYAIETYKAGKEAYPDLSEAIGSRKEREWVLNDLAKIEEAWNIVSGKQSSVDSDLDGLLSGTTASASSAGVATSESTDNILSSLADEGPSDDDDSATDFESLLKGLGA